MTELADRSQHLTDGVDSSKDTIEPPRPEKLLLPREETLPEMYSLSFTAPVVTPGDHLLATMRDQAGISLRATYTVSTATSGRTRTARRLIPSNPITP